MKSINIMWRFSSVNGFESWFENWPDAVVKGSCLEESIGLLIRNYGDKEGISLNVA
jgi:hypothetical protein